MGKWVKCWPLHVYSMCRSECRTCICRDMGIKHALTLMYKIEDKCSFHYRMAKIYLFVSQPSWEKKTKYAELLKPTSLVSFFKNWSLGTAHLILAADACMSQCTGVYASTYELYWANVQC